MALPLASSNPSDPVSSAPPARVSVLEILVVFGITVGVSAVGNLWGRPGARAAVAFTNRHLYSLIIDEAVVTAVLLPWLVRRGWRPGTIAGLPTARDLVRGAGVWFLALACYWIFWVLLALLRPHTAAALTAEHRFTGVPADAVAIISASVLNPVFEEMLWLGYGVGRLATRMSLRSAAAISITLRVVAHAYQGPWSVLGVLPVAIAFTWYYGRTRRLWPVIIAHVLFDAIGLAQRLGA